MFGEGITHQAEKLTTEAKRSYLQRRAGGRGTTNVPRAIGPDTKQVRINHLRKLVKEKLNLA